MSFNDRTYTYDSVIKQLGLIELHCKDGSAVDAGCQCIDTKHLYLLEGLSEEGQGFALSEQERSFYEDLGNLVRLIRKNMEVEEWNLHGVMRQVMKDKHPVPLRGSKNVSSLLGSVQGSNAKSRTRSSVVLHNPDSAGRKYLPYGLTTCEKRYPSVRAKLSRCIKTLEKKGTVENPVAVCRASIPCPP